MSNTSLQSITIVAVEDDPADFGLIRAFSRPKKRGIGGINEPVLVWAKTLAEGIVIARNKKPDIVLLDLSLPDSAGLETVHAMRDALPDVPIVILTGQDDNVLSNAALQAGAQDYLVKGQFDHDALDRAVRHALVRNALELRLSESIQRLELALTGGDLGTWNWSVPSGNCTFNERWYEILGYSQTEIEPGYSSWLEMICPEDLAAVDNAMGQHLRGETQMYEAEYRVCRKDGHWLWVLDRGKVVERDCKGQPLRVAGTYLDITRQKRAEMLLLLSRNRLKEQVEEITFQLKELKEEFEDVNTTLKVLLKNKDAEKTTAQNALVYEMSHEVTPFLLKLKNSIRNIKEASLLDALEKNLQHLASTYGSAGPHPFLFLQFTPVETQVASLIRQGHSTKAIATLLSLSPETINVHRKHIRKKLGLNSKADNLRRYLASLPE